MYSSLAMLYATYVLKGVENGGRSIESVPASIRSQVEEIVAETKKQDENK